MAVKARFTEQIPVVCTPAQRAVLETDADTQGVSLASVVRAALDRAYGLEDGEFPAADPRRGPGSDGEFPTADPRRGPGSDGGQG